MTDTIAPPTPVDPATLKPGDAVLERATGALWLFREFVPASLAPITKTPLPDRLQVSAPGEKAYRVKPVEDFDLVLERSARAGFDMNLDILPRVWGWRPWENVERVEPDYAIECAMGCRFLPITESGWANGWPGAPSGHGRYFLDTGQGGYLNGKAIVIFGREKAYRDDPALVAPVVAAARALVANQAAGRSQQSAGDLAAAVLALEAGKKLWTGPLIVFRVAICDHQVTDHSTPQGRVRGWHPASCAKCGMDLSVDSSD